VSLVGERHIGKSSLLNQWVLSLTTEPGVLVMHANTQAWTGLRPYYADLWHTRTSAEQSCQDLGSLGSSVETTVG
jgi:hypothetical protein